MFLHSINICLLCILILRAVETMELITTADLLHGFLASLAEQGKTIGFVPTMGALHQGHLSLVRQCIADNDVCVVSIFVNPTQFNNKEDLIQYPRSLEKDTELLREEGVAFIFAPSVEEIYPEPDIRQFDFGQLDKVMEGRFRPGHFNGVAQVVSRLFDIVKPGKAYFGQKDFQQLAIIRAMVKQLKLPVRIVSMPIVREDNGLAMSSRNERLTSGQRETAANIYKILLDSKENMYLNQTVKNTIDKVTEKINLFEGLNVEYFDIVDGNTLQSVTEWDESDFVVGCIAVFCGEVRLIDNIIYHSR